MDESFVNPLTVVVGLGSNMGDARRNIESAIEKLSRIDGVRIVSVSPSYRSEAVGPPQPDYVNAAVRVETTLVLAELHAHTQLIEQELGRVREQRWGPRTIDLDLLWSDAPPTSTESLTVPHPELERRAFALGPLLDVAPELGARLCATLESLGGRPPRADVE